MEFRTRKRPDGSVYRIPISHEGRLGEAESELERIKQVQQTARIGTCSLCGIDNKFIFETGISECPRLCNDCLESFKRELESEKSYENLQITREGLGDTDVFAPIRQELKQIKGKPSRRRKSDDSDDEGDVLLE